MMSCYKAYSENPASEPQVPAKEILNYRKALCIRYDHLKQHNFDENYFVKMYRIVSQFSDGTRSPIAQVYIKEGGSGPNAGTAFYTPSRGKGLLKRNFITY